ncbi:hypothetical protein HJFPF1_10136 [Paramyrothecium foliicola]|nr:hypothetical protein HJFPF1_10136 [Paramyrothecium foliicola]
MYSSGLPRYHPLHDPESQQAQQARSPSRNAVATVLDPRTCRSYVAHALSAVCHVGLLLFALRGWSSCAGNCSEDLHRVEIPFRAFAMTLLDKQAAIVGFVNWLFVIFIAPLEVHIISLPVREFSSARYFIHYAGCIFCSAAAIVDFKYAVRFGAHAEGWTHMLILEAWAVMAGLINFYVVAVNGFKVYQAWNTAQAFANVPKIKIEDTSDIKSKDGDR